MLLQMRKIC